MLPRRTKFYAVCALLLLVFTSLLTACGASGSGASSNGVVTVNWWSWNPGLVAGKNPWVETFNASHSNIKVVYKFQQYDDYITSLKLAMASGTGPDIFGSQAGAMQKVYGPFMEDLTPYAQKAWGDNWRSRFLDFGLKPLVSGTTTRSLPFYLSAAGYLWYNKTIFDKYGLQPPKTFDEWITVSKTLSSKGVTPFVQGAKDAWVNYDMYMALAHNIAPGKFFDAVAGKTPWTDPDLVKAMDYWHQLFHNGIMQKGALGLPQYPDADNQFSTGKAAMILFGTWNNGDMTKTRLAANAKTLGVKDTYEFLPVAFPRITNDGKRSVLFGGPDVALAMNKDSKVKDAAWQVLQWLTSEQSQQIHAKNLEAPSIKGVSIDEGDISTDNQKAAIKTEEQDLNNVIGPREIQYPELQTALSDALQNVATDSQTPQQALAAVEKVSAALQR